MMKPKPFTEDTRRQPPVWRIMIVPVGTPEDGDQAQKRALEIIAKRYRAKQSSYPPRG